MSDQAPPVPAEPGAGVDQALLERAEASRLQAEASAGAEQGKRLVLFAFELGGMSFAVPAINVRSVEDLKAPCLVPGCPPHVPGVVGHAGRVLPLLDLARFLGLEETAPPSEDDLGRRMLVMSSDDIEVAVPCDRALGLVDLLESELAIPSVFQGKMRRFLKGEIHLPQGVLALFDLGSLLDTARVA